MSACEACQAIQTSRAAQGETPRRSQNRTNWTGSFVISQAVRPIRPGSRSFQRPNLDHLLRPRQLSLRGLSRERAWHHDVGGSAVFPTAMRCGYTWITSSSTRCSGRGSRPAGPGSWPGLWPACTTRGGTTQVGSSSPGLAGPNNSCAGSRCDIADGFVHPQFASGRPGKVRPSGPPIDPYNQAVPAGNRPTCQAVTRT